MKVFLDSSGWIELLAGTSRAPLFEPALHVDRLVVPAIVRYEVGRYTFLHQGASGRELALTALSKFEQVPVDVAAHPDLPALRTALEEAAAAAQGAAEGRGLLLEAVLEGEGPVTPDLRRAGVAEALLEELRRARPPLTWWTRLTDRTRNMYDPEATRERNDFIGAVARQGDHLRTQPAELAALIEETVRSGGRLGMEAPTPEEWEALLAEAERLAVLTLLDEGGA